MKEFRDKSSSEKYSIFAKALSKVLIQNKVIIDKNDRQPIVYKSNKLKKLVKLKERTESPEELSKMKKLITKEVMILRKKKYNTFIKTGYELLKGMNSRDAWQWVKKMSRLNQMNKTSECLTDHDGNVVYDIDKRLKIARDFLAKNAAKEETPNDEVVTSYDRDPAITAMMDGEITWEEILSSTKKCQNNKAASNDLIPCEVYRLIEKDPRKRKNFSKAIHLLMKDLYNDSGIPDEWKKNTIVLIHKKGDPRQMDNYRGITLINTFSKVLCKILAQRLSDTISLFGLIRKEQVGFIKNEEGLSAVLTAIEAVRRRRISDQVTWMIFLDLKKAYDLVPHRLILSKLERKGFGPKFVNMIKALYQTTELQVRLDGKLSESFVYERGVRQGCTLSPLLFNIYR